MVGTRLLITGGSGFIGREVVARFQRANWEVLSLDHTNHHNLQFESRADLLENPSGLVDVIREYRPNTIIHLAAKSSISLSW